jgi:hypothetical protein
MKKMWLIPALILISCFIANGQYKINKTKYDYRTYSYQMGDPYNPGNAGVASFFIPGLGQMMSGENGRGLGFLAGYTGWIVGSSVVIIYETVSRIDEHSEKANIGLILIIGAVGAISIDIWSVTDAIRVAKVNNMALRDKDKSSFNLSIKPYIDTSYSGPEKNVPVGLSLNITFW